MVRASITVWAVSLALRATVAQEHAVLPHLGSALEITHICPGRSQHATSLTCGTVGGLQESRHAFRGTVTSLNQCAAACYSLPHCKSFSYNSPDGRVCSIYNQEFARMMFEKTASKTRFFNRGCFDCQTIDTFSPADTAADQPFILSVAVRSWTHNRNATEYASLSSPSPSPDASPNDQVLLLQTTTSRSEATSFTLGPNGALVWADTGLEARIGNYPGICRSNLARSSQIRFSAATSDKLDTLLCDIVGGEVYCSFDCFRYFSLWGEVGPTRRVMAMTHDLSASGVAFDVTYVPG